MKVKHVLLLLLAAVGLLYVWHMVSSHQGQGILGGLGISGH